MSIAITWKGALVAYGVAVVLFPFVWAYAMRHGRAYENSDEVREYEAEQLRREARIAELARCRARQRSAVRHPSSRP